MLRTRSLFLAVIAVACTACTPQGQCETQLGGIAYCKPGGTCNAMLKTPFEWHSNPIDKYWIEFPPYRRITMYLNDPNGMSFAGTVDEIIPYVSSDTNKNGSDAVIAGGNLAIFSVDCPGVDGGPTTCIGIQNETCATTYVRVIVKGH